MLSAEDYLSGEPRPTEVRGQNWTDLQEARMPPTEVPDCRKMLGSRCLKIAAISDIQHWTVER